jgi:hypothetical protein
MVKEKWKTMAGNENFFKNLPLLHNSHYSCETLSSNVSIVIEKKKASDRLF